MRWGWVVELLGFLGLAVLAVATLGLVLLVVGKTVWLVIRLLTGA